jgi:hypothetical protein
MAKELSVEDKLRAIYDLIDDSRIDEIRNVRGELPLVEDLEMKLLV